MLYSWYQDDIWEEDSLANKMIRRVNSMHKHVADQVRNIDEIDVEVEKVFREADIDCEGELCEQDRILLADIAAIRDNTDIPQEFYDYINDSKPFSEVDMALIQGSFFAPYLLYPEHYGTTKVSRNDLESFTHLWRTFGYYLGISDAFNAVLADFEDCKLYCYIVMEKIIKPCMLHLDIYGIHMAKAAVFFTDYHVVAYTNYQLVGYNLPNLWASFSALQRAKYYIRNVWSFLAHLPGISQLLNSYANKTLKRIFQHFNRRYSKQQSCPF